MHTFNLFTSQPKRFQDTLPGFLQAALYKPNLCDLKTKVTVDNICFRWSRALEDPNIQSCPYKGMVLPPEAFGPGLSWAPKGWGALSWKDILDQGT